MNALLGRQHEGRLCIMSIYSTTSVYFINFGISFCDAEKLPMALKLENICLFGTSALKYVENDTPHEHLSCHVLAQISAEGGRFLKILRKF